MHAPNVLRVNPIEEQAGYREAVAQILRNVQTDNEVTLLDISERIGISLGTVSNAANKKADLCATYLKRIGAAYGCQALDPYARLMGGRVVPVEANGCDDILPLMLAVAQLVAAARSPTSPGGTAETLREQLGYLPELRKVRRECDALIAQIEARKEAA